jgi:hypothetical protein
MWGLRIEIVTEGITILHTIAEPYLTPLEEWLNLSKGIETRTEELSFYSGRYHLNISSYDISGEIIVPSTLEIRCPQFGEKLSNVIAEAVKEGLF